MGFSTDDWFLLTTIKIIVEALIALGVFGLIRELVRLRRSGLTLSSLEPRGLKFASGGALAVPSRRKLPTAEACGLSIELRIWLHSNIVPNGIWTTEESVYGDSPAGKAEGFFGWEIPSLQQGFRGNSQTRLTVAVHDEAAFASEQGIVGGIVAFSHSTAVGAPPARMPTINTVQLDSFVEASLLKVSSESVEGYSHHLTVEAFSSRIEPFQVLNGDFSIIRERKISGVSDNLPDPILHEVTLPMLGCVKFLLGNAAASVSVGAEKALPFKDMLASFPDVLAQIQLPEDFAFRGQDADGEALAVHIDAENVLPSGHSGFLLGEVCDNLEVRCESESFASPAASDQAAEPIPVPILLDWDGYSPFRVEPKFNEVERFGFECLAVARNIELDCDTFYSNAGFLLPPSNSCNVTDDLTVEPRASFDSATNSPPEARKPSVVLPHWKNPVGFISGLLQKTGKRMVLRFCSFSLKKNSPLQSPNRSAGQCHSYLTVPSPIPPTTKAVGFLGGF